MDNTGKEKEAMQLMAEADKKVKASGSFLGGMFGYVVVYYQCRAFCLGWGVFMGLLDKSRSLKPAAFLLSDVMTSEVRSCGNPQK